MADTPRLHVEAEGRGESLILGHGFGGSARNFRGQARALAARYRVVRFDARGHARSESPTDPAAYTPDALIADLARIVEACAEHVDEARAQHVDEARAQHVDEARAQHMDEARAQHVDEARPKRTDDPPRSAPAAAPPPARAIVGGLSMGAGIALRFALAHPERTRALVLAAFPAAADTPGGYASIAGRFADRLDRDGLEAAGAEFVWGPSSGLDEVGATLVRRGFLEHRAYALAAILRGVIALQPAVAELTSALASLRIPTLVVVGTRDRISLASSRAVAAAIPNARLVEIADAGHLVNLARPAEFNAAVMAFLDGLPSA